MQSSRLIINVVNIVIFDLCVCIVNMHVLTMIRAGDTENTFGVQEFSSFFFFLILEGQYERQETPIIVSSFFSGDLIIDTRDSFFLLTHFKAIACTVTLGDCSGPAKTRPALTYNALRGNISADPQRERPWLRNTETQIPRRVRLSLSLSIFVFFSPSYCSHLSYQSFFTHKIRQLVD